MGGGGKHSALKIFIHFYMNFYFLLPFSEILKDSDKESTSLKGIFHHSQVLLYSVNPVYMPVLLKAFAGLGGGKG